MKHTNRSKKIVLFSKFSLLFAIATPLFLATAISCANNQANTNTSPEITDPGSSNNPKPPLPQNPKPPAGGEIPTPPQPEPPKPLPENNDIFKSFNINSFNNMQTKIVNDAIERTINNQVYETELVKTYGTQFKYPAWNFNYETNNQANRWQQIGNETIDASTLVFNEMVPDFKNSQNQSVRYSDPSFILNEIKNKTLKKHPAADEWYQQKVTPETKAINKFFSIPSRVLGPTALGLFIPAGEIATLQFTPATLAKMQAQKINNFRIILNSSFWDNRDASNSGRISNRYPFVRTEFNVDLKTLVANEGKFEFGSPFGGTISIKLNSRLQSATSNAFYSAYDNFDFNVIGAVEALSYFHTVTSEQDWKQQVDKVVAGKITAPVLALDFAFGSTNIAATGLKQFAYKNVQDIVFPFEILEKWTAFLFTSEFFGSRDKNNNVKKLDFEFCDDIWGGAAAWGGGDALYSPLGWARDAFLSGNSDWTIKRNWGTFHEINHNFQQNGALFQTRSHPETNQVTMVNLSLLSDSGRWRNLYNPASDFTTGGWTRLQNLFSTIQHMANNNYESAAKTSEYEMQNILLYTLGTFNFLDYVRYDVATNLNTGGFKEIVELSNYFKLNFWPAFEKFSPWWTDGWPASYDEANAEQKSQIDLLNKSYKAIDFVGNVFATGSFLYNQTTEQYDYTNDMQAPIDIPAGKPFVFDFEKGINSANKNFQWTKLNFKETTKLGGTLTLDAENSKKLIYTPPTDFQAIGQVDEFVMSITPGEFDNKPANYVSEYMWKIKVRLTPNLPVVSVYKNPEPQQNNVNFGKKDYEYMKDENNIAFASTSNPRLGLLHVQDQPTQLSKWQRAKVAFNFVAPKSGNYQFKIKAMSWIFIVNPNEPDKFLWQTKKSAPSNWTDTFSINLEAGQSLPLEIYLTTKWNTTRLEFKAVVDNQEFNVFDHAVVPWASDLIAEPKKFLEPAYAYKPRTLNFNDFQTSLFGLNVARDLPILEKTTGQNTNYTFVAKIPNDPKIDQQLAKPDNKYFEKWGTKPYNMSFAVNFTKPQPIGSIFFHHRTNNHPEARPTWMKITDETGAILFEGSYGSQFNDRRGAISKINFNQVVTVSQLNFEFRNNNHSGIIFDALQFSSEQFLPVNKVVSIQNPAISIYGENWELVANDPDINLSAVNGVSLKSSQAQQYFEFKIFAQGFDLVGQKGPDTGQFDLFIDDQLITTVETVNSTKLYNQILYSYSTSAKSKGQMIKVRVVAKSDKPLFFNYLQTYGSQVYLEAVEKATF